MHAQRGRGEPYGRDGSGVGRAGDAGDAAGDDAVGCSRYGAGHPGDGPGDAAEVHDSRVGTRDTTRGAPGGEARHGTGDSAWVHSREGTLGSPRDGARDPSRKAEQASAGLNLAGQTRRNMGGHAWGSIPLDAGPWKVRVRTRRQPCACHRAPMNACPTGTAMRSPHALNSFQLEALITAKLAWHQPLLLPESFDKFNKGVLDEADSHDLNWLLTLN